MARTITPLDAHAIMNELVAEAVGIGQVQSNDISSFVSCGELVLSTGMENVVNALNIVLNRTLVAARPYSAKLKLMQALDTGIYSNRLRKISYYARWALPDGSHNTDLFTNLADGFTSGQNPDANGNAQSTKSQWEQVQPMPLEMNFAGSSVWQDCITMYDDQVQAAFRGPEEFARFVSGYLTEHGNDIESQKEAWNRMALLQKIASTYYYAANNLSTGQVVNLTTAFNTRFSTNYTSAQLRSTYLKEFLAFFVSTFKLVSKFMTERSAERHINFQKTVDGVDYAILRHTPYSRQRVYLYSPLFTQAEALVLPEIFHPKYLDLDTQYEEVTYWQGISDRAEINVTPAIINNNGEQAAASAAVELEYVVGAIMDEDALMTNFQLERADTTVLEARKHFRNTWNTFMKCIIEDPSENCVIFIMDDSDVEP